MDMKILFIIFHHEAVISKEVITLEVRNINMFTLAYYT